MGLHSRKHIILKSLHEKYISEDGKARSGYSVTELCRSMTNVQLSHTTHIDRGEVDDLCYTLINAGHVKMQEEDGVNQAHHYLITRSGRQAFVDKAHLNREWYRPSNLVFPLFLFLVYMSSFLYLFLVNADLRSNVEVLGLKVQTVEGKVKPADDKVNPNPR